MPIFDLELPYFVTYSGYTVNCVISGIPTGVTLDKGKAMIKRNKNDADADAIVTKLIIATLTPDGQITDTGADTHGSAVFVFSAVDTAMADPALQSRYEIGIKFYLSAGEPLTFAHCYIKPIAGVVKALS